jgi:hypothetical protein
MALFPEAPDQGLAEMAGASRDQDFHRRGLWHSRNLRLNPARLSA